MALLILVGRRSVSHSSMCCDLVTWQSIKEWHRLGLVSLLTHIYASPGLNEWSVGPFIHRTGTMRIKAETPTVQMLTRKCRGNKSWYFTHITRSNIEHTRYLQISLARISYKVILKYVPVEPRDRWLTARQGRQGINEMNCCGKIRISEGILPETIMLFHLSAKWMWCPNPRSVNFRYSYFDFINDSFCGLSGAWMPCY